jgi:hypothetical protein
MSNKNRTSDKCDRKKRKKKLSVSHKRKVCIFLSTFRLDNVVKGRSVLVPTENYKDFSNEDEVTIKYYKIDQEARLNSSCIVNLISWNTMGSTAAGYARLRKRTFSLISMHSPTDIWPLQEPFSCVRSTLLREMGLRALDRNMYNARLS